MTFLPIGISYEQIAEEDAYRRELAGAEKKKEDLGQVVRVEGEGQRVRLVVESAGDFRRRTVDPRRRRVRRI